MFTISNKCLLCSAPTKLVLALGETPLANELPKKKGKVDTFPLNLVQCSKCSHLQIDCLVDETRLYGHYLYVSDTSQGNRDHFKAYADAMVERFKPTRVLDIGSNDGLFLSYFKEHGLDVYGVDPARNIAKKANRNGITTLCGFFGEEFAKQFKGEQFSLITCNNCFAHNADLHTVAKGVKHLLAPEGAFIFEVSYGIDLLSKNLFDLIYHEHIHHWTIKPAIKFFRQHDLEVVDVQRIPTHGGSIRVTVVHTEYAETFRKRHIEAYWNVAELVEHEDKYLLALVKYFPTAVQGIKSELTSKLDQLTKAGKKVAILGYPAKAATLGAYFGLKPYISAVYDDNPLKVGRYSHLGLQIQPTRNLHDGRRKAPDYLLVLAWNYAGDLMARFPTYNFIVPLPEVRIYE